MIEPLYSPYQAKALLKASGKDEIMDDNGIVYTWDSVGPSPIDEPTAFDPISERCWWADGEYLGPILETSVWVE